MLVFLSMIEDPRDQEKFARLYEQNRSLMFVIANEILHHEQDSEDALQEAFTRIARNIHKVDEVEHPLTKGFVAMITKNAAIDVYQDRKRDYEVKNLNLPYAATDHFTETMDLTWAILKLSERDQQIIFLRYAHGLEVEELAVALGISKEAAYKADQRARERLEELCKEVELL